MNRFRLAVVVLVVLALAATTATAGQKFKCNANGRVFRVTGNASAFDATLTWIGGGSDNDLFAFSEVFDGILAAGLGVENRIERIAFGTLPGDTLEIVAVKAGGGNTNCILNINAAFQASRGQLRVSDRGSLVELARTDPRYAEILERVRAERAGKQRIVP